MAAGITTGDIRLTNDVATQPMSSDFERLRQEFGFPGDDRVVAKCFLLWARVVGAISLEVFGQYGADTLTDPRRCSTHRFGCWWTCSASIDPADN